MKKDDNQEEKNLKTVILLNPKNEEAIYSLAKLKLKNSDFQKSRELNERLGDLCIKFCEKSSKLKKEKKYTMLCVENGMIQSLS